MLCPQEAAERLLAAVTRTVFSMTNQGLIGGRLLEIRTCGGAVRNAGCYTSTKFYAGRISAKLLPGLISFTGVTGRLRLLSGSVGGKGQSAS